MNPIQVIYAEINKEQEVFDLYYIPKDLFHLVIDAARTTKKNKRCTKQTPVK